MPERKAPNSGVPRERNRETPQCDPFNDDYFMTPSTTPEKERERVPDAVELFRHPILNKLAKSDFRMAMVGYPMAGLALFVTGLYLTAIPWYMLLITSVVSYVGWTLIEYLMHRYVYHEITRIAGTKRFQYIFHGIHHQQPNRRDKMILPPAPWAVALLMFFALFYLLAGEYAFGILPGLVLGYTCYTYVHYNIHQANCPRWLQHHRIHHQLHHHRHPDKAFGVTSPVWDRIFGTMPPERIGWNR